MSTADELWMEDALREAELAKVLGEVPVGAIMVAKGVIVARSHNRPISDSDPTAHAEILALRAAARIRSNYRLSDCTLYVTLEPCAMCASAMTHSRIQRLVYGASDPKAGAVTSVVQLLNHPSANHTIEVTSGILAARSMELLQSFFRERRSKPETV